MNFFCRRTHAQNEHGFTFLEAINVHMTRMPSFCKLKMLRDAQIQIVVSKMFQKRQSHSLQTQTVHKSSFQSKCFFPKNGGGPGGPTQAQSACPHSLEKTFYGKEHLCNVCVCKKWDWRFLKHLAVLTLWICACLSIFSLQKDWIRIFWTFIDSKKVNPCFFCSCVLLQKMYPCFDFEFEKDEILLVWVSFKILLTKSKIMHYF